ncbi:MAG: hypothetical protein HZC48_08190 [Nitrospirae bacterium]|nr:hypothetical protein [Nitrospirota bacterium]
MGIVAGGITGAFTGAIVGAVGFALAEAGFGRGFGIFGPSPLVGALSGAIMVGLAGFAAGAISGGIGGERKWSCVAGGSVGLLAAIYVFSVHADYFAEYGVIAFITVLSGSVGASIAGGELCRHLIYLNKETWAL